MICVLCATPIDLFDLDEQGWCGEPAHRTCATAARDAFDEACERIAAEHRRHGAAREPERRSA